MKTIKFIFFKQISLKPFLQNLFDKSKKCFKYQKNYCKRYQNNLKLNHIYHHSGKVRKSEAYATNDKDESNDTSNFKIHEIVSATDGANKIAYILSVYTRKK